MNILTQIEEYTPGKYLKLDNIPNDKKQLKLQYVQEIHAVLDMVNIYRQYLMDNNLIAKETDNIKLVELQRTLNVIDNMLYKSLMNEERYSKVTTTTVAKFRQSTNYFVALSHSLVKTELSVINNRVIILLKNLLQMY